ncbi:AraC family transcriptional regulator [Polycyclovorans algicola]|uniref:AraC family transcriptional regulator n=1 Tax=Polycyclovorans algicola TaxID=616992 RepID=UPI0004A702C7|nr:AraC family transcriptional regulator [Polycyclovorans algicola]
MTDHIQTTTGVLEPRVPARYYLRMAELLVTQGVDVTALLQSVGLRPAALQLPDASLTLSQLETLLAAVMTLRPDSALPFHLGRSLKPSAHSLVGYGMLSSPTVDHALRFVARYFKLVMPTFRMRYRSGGGRAELLFEPVQPMSTLNLHFHLEAIAVAAHHEVRDLLAAPMPPHRISLSIPEPPHVALYAGLENARCHFLAGEAPAVRLQFEADFSRHAPAMADHSALRAAEAQCRILLRGQRGQDGVASWTRMMLREAHGGIPQLSDLARTLNRSPRTLDRYLQREGPGFRAMALAQRMDRARDMLMAGDLSVTEIALELGYSDASNFTRAFRKHFGAPPKSLRAGRPSQQ